MELPSEAMRFDLLKQLADIKPSTPQPENRRRSGVTIPVHAATGRNTRGAAENDDPITRNEVGQTKSTATERR